MSVILLIEDSPIDKQRVVSGLEQVGYTMYSVDNGQQGLNYLTSCNEDSPIPDVIITDIVMPEVNGFQFLRSIKQQQPFNQIPVIVTSIKSEPNDISWATRQGANAFMAKPVDIDELIIKVRQNLSK